MNMLDEDLARDTFAPPPCLTIKTGRGDCYARFYPSLYQLTLVTNGVEEKVDLGFSGSRLLERLAQIPGEVVAREELMSHAWSGRVVGQGSLNQQIHTLRQVLGDERERNIIQTLPRRGYLLNPQHLITLELPSANAQTHVTPVSPQEDAHLQLAPMLSPSADAQPQITPALPLEDGQSQATPVSANSPPSEEPVRAQQSSRYNNRGFLAVSLMALLGVFFLGYLARSDGPSPLRDNAIHSGKLMITYVDQPPPEQFERLRSQTQPLTTRLEQLVDQPTRLFVSLRGEFYKLICMQANGRARSVVIHRSQLNHVADEQLQWCFPRMNIL